LEKAQYKKFCSLFNTDEYCQDNAKDVVEEWKELSRKDKKILGKDLLTNVSVHSTILRHW
jgi:hypothetical protein